MLVKFTVIWLTHVHSEPWTGQCEACPGSAASDRVLKARKIATVAPPVRFRKVRREMPLLAGRPVVSISEFSAWLRRVGGGRRNRLFILGLLDRRL